MNDRILNLSDLYLPQMQKIDWMVIRSEIILSNLYPQTFQLFKDAVKTNKRIPFNLSYATDDYFITFYAKSRKLNLPILIAFVEDYFDHPLTIVNYAASVYYGFGVKYGIVSIITQGFTENHLEELSDKIFAHYDKKINS